MLDKLLAACLVLCTSVQPAIEVTNKLPVPKEYQEDTSVTLETHPPLEVEYFCLDGKWDPDHVYYACYHNDKLIMPNPCWYPEASDTNSYAYLLCHELAHKNGWRH